MGTPIAEPYQSGNSWLDVSGGPDNVGHPSTSHSDSFARYQSASYFPVRYPSASEPLEEMRELAQWGLYDARVYQNLHQDMHPID